jgi:hypothetical protein
VKVRTDLLRSGHRTSISIAGIVLAVTAVLSVASHAANSRNNAHLLALQTEDAGSEIGAILPDIQTPLASAAALADTTNGNVAQFTGLMSPDAGSRKLFASVSLWSLSGPNPRVITVLGAAPLLEQSLPQARSLFSRALASGSIAVTGILGGEDAHLGYAFTTTPTSQFAVYAESPLPANKRAEVQKNSAFSDLNYALYLGPHTTSANLIEASTLALPLGGPTARSTVPFGDSSFTVVASATRQLSGTLSSDIWWLIAILGVVMAAAGVAVSERLMRGQLLAETVAAENGRLYAEQRNVAETLQHALLPDAFPDHPDIEVRARYVAGVEGLDVGGDWYEVRELDDDRLLFVVGDVSGRGLRAASVMASIRYSIAAYAIQGDPPEVIFEKLAEVVNITRDRHFATVICALIDTKSHDITLVNAGHPPVLLRVGDATEFLVTPTGPPIGVPSDHRYVPTTVTIPPGATLIGYTDGLVERRGENLDLGLERLRRAVDDAAEDNELDDLLGELVDRLTPDGPADDVALIGVRWHR